MAFIGGAPHDQHCQPAV